MNNTYKIQWSKRAVNDFSLIVSYLSQKWGEQEIRKFVRLIDKRINQIQGNPGTYSFSFYRSGLHRCVASKIHTILSGRKRCNLYCYHMG